MTRTCSKCHAEKDAGLFPAQGNRCNRCIADYGAAWRRANHERMLIYRAVRDALRSGELVRPSACSKCGTECAPEGHHEDYAKPLVVTWLCNTCHHERHRVRNRRPLVTPGQEKR